MSEGERSIDERPKDESALGEIIARVDRAAQNWKRSPQEITLIAVSKTFEGDAIEPVLAAGHRQFGENRVQEAQKKWPDLKARYSNVRLHLLGPLQSNKVKDAVALFDVIHSLDRPKLAAALATCRDQQGRCPDLFIQVNTGAEPQKAGVRPEEATDFIAHCRDGLSLPVVGLMCIPPAEEAPAPHFALLANLAEAAGLPCLSMGMSDDFEIAIAQGATHIRVGRAIFGDRSAAITPPRQS